MLSIKVAHPIARIYYYTLKTRVPLLDSGVGRALKSSHLLPRLKYIIINMTTSKPVLLMLEIYQIKENKMAYTLLTKVGVILKDPQAVKILEKYVPGISKNPLIGLAKGMTVKALLAMPQAKQAGLTEAMVAKVMAEINTPK
jgi:hypothetical protein